jgi:hypothetical protein
LEDYKNYNNIKRINPEPMLRDGGLIPDEGTQSQKLFIG